MEYAYSLPVTEKSIRILTDKNEEVYEQYQKKEYRQQKVIEY